MIYCPQCGTACEQTHRFCFQCGAPLPIAESQLPEQVLPAEAEASAAIEAPEITEEPTLPPEEALEAPPAEAAPPAPARRGSLWPPLLIMAVMLSLGFLLFFLVPARSADDTPWLGVDDGALVFYEHAYTGGPELEIPEIVDGQRVTAISSHCFAECDGLTTVKLPRSVTAIHDNAFRGCDSLRGIEIPQGCAIIGRDAFRDCATLEALSLPGSLRTVGDNAFAYCHSLRHIFYAGPIQDWAALYDGYINGEVRVYAEDGAFLHKNLP